MMAFDDLRKVDDEDFEFELEDEGDDSAFDDSGSAASGRMFLGMTPIERMFIAIFLFMNVVVLGLALLLATNRLQF